VRGDPDPPPGQFKGDGLGAFIDHRTEKKCLSCEPYQVETSRERARMRCAKGKHYYYLVREHVCIFTSFTVVSFVTAGEETLKW
jgi:hypothetical protein